MKIFSFITVLLFIAAYTYGVQAQESVAWQVTKYDISATLPTGSTDRNLAVKAVVSVKNVGRSAGGTVTFRINPKAEVAAAQVNDATANFRKIADDRLAGLQRFTVNLLSPVQPNGTTIIAVSYRLPVAENDGLSAISLLNSQFLPLALWYPTPTNPYSPRGADYAPFRLSVVAPNGNTVVSSGKANGAVFEQTLNAQPFFVSGAWDLVEGANGITVYLPKGATADERRRAEELIVLSSETRAFSAQLLGNELNVPIRLVAVNRGAGFADGGTILLDEAAFRRSKLDKITAMTIAEAVAKIWLGNSTTVRGEGYGAIQEGLARFVATRFIENRFGKEMADIERLRQRTSYVAVAKREDDAPLALNSPSIETYFASVPNKGAMIWRLVAREMGEDKFFNVVRAQLQGERGNGLTLTQLRSSLTQVGGERVKAVLDYGLDQSTDLDLLVGLPQIRGADTAVALRNTGSLPVSASVVATTDKGERLIATTNVADKNFGEVIFKTNAKIALVEIDPDKLYPQIDYANDFAPRESLENDLLASITIVFNRQDYAKAEAAARKVLAVQPHFDEARTWLGRTLLEQNRLDEAEKEFNSALNEKLPALRTLAWANVGLGEIFMRRNQSANAIKFFDAATKADAEYASNLAARQGRLRAEATPTIDESAKTFFAGFDRAILTGRKAEVDNFILPGELASFSARLTANQPEQWQTKVVRTETLNAERMTVEVSLNAKLLNKEPSAGTALFTLARTPNGWKLAEVDLFEVR